MRRCRHWRGSTRWCSSARAARTSRGPRPGRSKAAGRPLLFSPQGAGDLADAAVQERQRRLIGYGVLGEGGLFGGELDGVAVLARLERHAVERVAVDRSVDRAAL